YRSSTASRKRIDASLRRLASVMLSFTSTHSSKVYTTHLVQSALLDPDSDQVELQIDPKIFELYQYDHKVLMQLKAIKELAKKESAQALYTFIESLPPNPIPISLTRLKNRLNLKTRANSQNATVRKALEELASIGYLQYTEVKKDGKVYFQIHKRDPDLNLNNIQPPPDGDGEGDADEENNGTSGKNNGEPLEGELCPPDEPIDGDETLTIHDLTAEELHYIRSLRSQKKNNPAS
ncbi:TPA: replication protein RepA, partial [Klebsiella pneumoniae]|nr:replication protein RepA [Klebsiella pneumoniae]